MSGFLFFGTDETPGNVVEVKGKKYKEYKGMYSLHANKKLNQVENNHVKHDRIITEGVEAFVPYKGKLSDVFFQIIGGIKHDLSYCGAKNIQELQQKAQFIKITGGGLKVMLMMLCFCDSYLKNLNIFHTIYSK